MCIQTMSKVFKQWTEEERRAHVRAKNLAFLAKKEVRITLTKKRIKEQEKQKKLEMKQKIDACEWVPTGKAKPKPKATPVAVKVVTKNAFSALESDEEVCLDDTPPTFEKKKFNWADSDDE
jgi:hypothetical protein